MKRLIQLVSRLYPASWRRRYGVEFAALLEDVDPDWHALLNVLRGVAEMQIRAWNFGKILVVAGVLGTLVGLVAWLVTPNRYASIVVVKIALSPDGPATDEALGDHVSSLAVQSMSRSYLTQMIRRLKLYKSDQAKIPLEDIVSSMKEDITIRPIGRASDGESAVFSIQFVYNDPVIAQRVIGELAAKFVDSNFDLGLRNTKWGATLEVLSGASLTSRPFSPRPSRTIAVGVGSGLVLGTFLAFIRRAIRPAQAPGTG